MDILRKVTATLQQQLGQQVDQLARECGLVQRQRKFTGQSLLRMLVLTLLRKPDASNADFFATAIQVGLDVCPSAVDKRLQAGQPLTDFLRLALERALRQVVAAQPCNAGLLQHFTAVYIGDSSVIPLPDELADDFPGTGGSEGTSRAALKIHVLWEYKSGALQRLEVTAG